MDGALAIGTKLRARMSQKNVNHATNVIAKPSSEDDNAKQVEKEEISYSTNESLLEVGSRVEALYHGRGRRYYKGSIVSVHDDGSYDVHYDDGDKDSRLAAEFIRRIPTSSRPTSSKTEVKTTTTRRLHDDNKRRESVDVEMNVAADDTSRAFNVGDRIEAKFKGKGKRYYKGKIVGVHDDGSYDIDYDDGDKDRGLSGIHIRARVPRSSTKANKTSPKEVPVPIEHIVTNKDDLEAEKNMYDDNRLPDDTQVELKSSIRSPISFVVPVRSEDDKRDDDPNLEEETEAREKEETIPVKEETRHKRTLHSPIKGTQNEMTLPLSKGNRLYSGVVSKVKIVHLYEIKYKDGTRDMNIPFEALCMDDDEVSPSDIQEGSTVKVVGWESRLRL